MLKKTELNYLDSKKQMNKIDDTDEQSQFKQIARLFGNMSKKNPFDTTKTTNINISHYPISKGNYQDDDDFDQCQYETKKKQTIGTNGTKLMRESSPETNKNDKKKKIWINLDFQNSNSSVFNVPDLNRNLEKNKKYEKKAGDLLNIF